MVDMKFSTEQVCQLAEPPGLACGWRWGYDEKVRIIAQAIVPGAVIAEVARQNKLTPQHLSLRISEAKTGRFALTGVDSAHVATQTVVPTDDSNGKDISSRTVRGEAIEICIGDVVVCVRSGCDLNLLRRVIRAVRYSV